MNTLQQCYMLSDIILHVMFAEEINCYLHFNGNQTMKSIYPPTHTHTCCAAYMRQLTGSALIKVMSCHPFGAMPLPEPMLPDGQLDPWEQTSVKLKYKFLHLHWRKCTWKCRLWNNGHFFPREVSQYNDLHDAISENITRCQSQIVSLQCL